MPRLRDVPEPRLSATRCWPPTSCPRACTFSACSRTVAKRSARCAPAARIARSSSGAATVARRPRGGGGRRRRARRRPIGRGARLVPRGRREQRLRRRARETALAAAPALDAAALRALHRTAPAALGWSARAAAAIAPVDWARAPAALDPERGGGVPPARAARKRRQVELLLGCVNALLPAAAPAGRGRGRRPRVADLCCGGGHVGLALAWARPDVDVLLVDANATALATAAARARAARVRVRAVRADLAAFAAGVDERRAALRARRAALVSAPLTDAALDACARARARVVAVPCCYGKLAHTAAHPGASRAAAAEAARGVGPVAARRPAEPRGEGGVGGAGARSAAFRGAGVARALHAVWAGAADHCEDDRRAAGAGGEARHCELLRRARGARARQAPRASRSRSAASAITVDAASAPELGQKHRLRSRSRHLRKGPTSASRVRGRR